MQVLKFGGTSVGTTDSISKVIAIVNECVQKTPTIVVVSAMSGVTDQLILLAQTASQGNIAYKTIIQNLAEKHEDAEWKIVFYRKSSNRSLTTNAAFKKCWF